MSPAFRIVFSLEIDAVMEETTERLRNWVKLLINSRSQQNKNWSLELAKEGEPGEPLGFGLGLQRARPSE